MKIVIVGAGEAGLRAAQRLSQAQAVDVTVVHGEVSPPYERPQLSKPDADGNAFKVIGIDLPGVKLLSARSAVSIDRDSRTVNLDDGTALAYDRLLIATGATPRRLASDPANLARVLRTDADARAIYSRAMPGGLAVIVGAGLIGLEMAAELAKRGMAVTVLEVGAGALGRALPPDIAAVIVERHLQAGVQFHFSVAIAAVAEDGVTLADGSRFAADLVVAAIGVQPETGLAMRAGLECNNGILVDERLRTSDENIFAAGDCANIAHPRYGRIRLETWRNASDQGAHAAGAILGETEGFAKLPWFWSDQYELGLQAVGLHEPGNIAITRPLGENGLFRFELNEAHALTAAFGVGVGNAAAKDVKLAERLMERGASVDPAALADPAFNIKQLLSGSRQF